MVQAVHVLQNYVREISEIWYRKIPIVVPSVSNA